MLDLLDGASGFIEIEHAEPAACGWREIDARLRDLARRRAALDAEEMELILLAQRAQVHRELGLGSFREYLEQVLGYTPRAAAERLRVADQLPGLPRIRAALAAGAVSYSAVRELTREVATAGNEAAWLDRIEGRTLREVEAIVAGRQPGAHPDDLPDPERVTHPVRFELSPSTLALLRQTQQALAERHGERISDDALIAELCHAALGDGEASGDPGRARYQIALTSCTTCDRTWQDGAGRAIEVAPAVMDQARCDAQHVGRIDVDTPTRATQDIPPAIRRLVWRRDHGRCVVPGCRAARGLEVHHVHYRTHGGKHEPRNLAVVCFGHHQAIHAGRLIIHGEAPALTFTHADGRPYGAPPPLTSASASPAPSPVSEDAIHALTGLGFPLREARARVADGLTHVGGEATLETVIRAALQRRPPT